MKLLSLAIPLLAGLMLTGCHHKNTSSPTPESYYKAPKGAEVFFVSPKNGATVKSPFKIVMGTKGITVAKAGILKEGTGHHHLLINVPHMNSGEVVPTTSKHIHFGKGQTETTVELPPGKHTLTLQFANGVHQSYGKQLSSTIEVTVVK